MRKTLFIFIALMMLFLLRFQFLPKLNLRDGQIIKITGTLSGEPQISGNYQSFKLGQIEIRTEKYPEYHYGDKLVITGRIKLTSPNNPLSSFKSYLLINPKDYLLISPKIEVLKSGSGLGNQVLRIRNDLRLLYQKYFVSPFDGLMSGIVLGDKSLIPYNTWQELRQTGTLHIMVASGMNIAMFSGTMLSFFCLFFRRKVAIVFLFITIWFYAVMTGFQPPIIRAAIMASLIYFSQMVGREAEAGRILWLTGILMLLINPLWLFDIGFQLSFLATAGLVYLQPRLSKSKFFLFKYESFSSSIASQLATLPVLVTAFGQLNLLSPVINLLVLWTIPYILQGGILIGIIGLLWQGLGGLLAYLLYPLLYYLNGVISLSAKISFTQILMPKAGWGLMMIYYFVLWLWMRNNLKFEI